MLEIQFSLRVMESHEFLGIYYDRQITFAQNMWERERERERERFGYKNQIFLINHNMYSNRVSLFYKQINTKNSTKIMF